MVQEEIANKIAKLVRIGARIPFISPHLLSDLTVIDLSEFLRRCQPKYEEMCPFLVDGEIASGGGIQTNFFVGNGFKPFPTV